MIDLPVDAAVPVGRHLDAVAVAEGAALAQGVRGGVFDHPVVDLGPLEPVALDAPALEDGQPTADQAHPDSGRAHDRNVEVDGLALLGHLVAADVEHDGAVAPVLATPRSPLVVGVEHVGDQAGIDADPAHVRAVAVPVDHADPAGRPGVQRKGTATAGRSPPIPPRRRTRRTRWATR